MIYYGQYNITERRRLFGVMHWYLRAPNEKPPFKIYVYWGEDKEKKVHFFRMRRGGDILMKTLKELALNSDFKPWCYNFKLVEMAIEKEKLSIPDDKE